MNWLRVCAVKLRSGLVFVRKFSFPMICLKRVGFGNGSPSSGSNLRFNGKGVETGLEVANWISFSSSVVNFLCVRAIPFER